MTVTDQFGSMSQDQILEFATSVSDSVYEDVVDRLRDNYQFTDAVRLVRDKFSDLRTAMFIVKSIAVVEGITPSYTVTSSQST